MRVTLTLSRQNTRLLCKLLTVKRHCRAAITIMKMSAGLLDYQQQYAKLLLSAPSCIKLQSELILRGCKKIITLLLSILCVLFVPLWCSIDLYRTCCSLQSSKVSSEKKPFLLSFALSLLNIPKNTQSNNKKPGHNQSRQCQR